MGNFKLTDVFLSFFGAILFVILINTVVDMATYTPEITTRVEKGDASKPLKKASSPAEKPQPAQTASADASPVMGNAASGAKLFKKKCKACHNAAQGASAKAGPNLWGVAGRAKAQAEGFKYSRSLQALGGDWTDADLAAFLTKPKAFAPKTKMSFAGLKKAQDRANIIAHLKTLN